MEFAERVYRAVERIPKGMVATYGQIAELIDCPGGARAVGNALHINPYAPHDDGNDSKHTRTVPCHRVVAADGHVAESFGCGGPAVHRRRLESEGVTFLPGTDRVDLTRHGIIIESHPLEPFLPQNGQILFLGSFPPPKFRWSMDFFYPNWVNDFWRIQGLLHFGDPHHFESVTEAKHFDRARIIDFCNTKGLAFFDTASKVCRLKGNASDEFLEILEPSNVQQMLSVMPYCKTIVTTGGKSTEELGKILGTPDTSPDIGGYMDLECHGRSIRWWRMPSSSRAYPMPLARKAGYYGRIIPE